MQPSIYSYSQHSVRQPIPRRDSVSLRELYWTVFNCNAATTALTLLSGYIHKNGWEWAPKYSRKCLQCGYEHPEKVKPEMCEKCGAASTYDLMGQEAKWFSEPPEELTKALDDWFETGVNRNKMTLKQLLHRVEMDLNIANLGCLIVSQDYGLDQSGEIVTADVKELSFPELDNFRFVADENTRVPGSKYWICLNCRPRLSKNVGGSLGANTLGVVYYAPGQCQNCAMKLHEVWWVTVKPGTDDPLQYYIEREVIFTHKYYHDYDYGGLGSAAGIIEEMRLLIYQTRYSSRFYTGERSPRDLTLVYTHNEQGLKNVLEEANDIYATEGGSYHPVIAVQPVEGVTQPFHHIELSKPPADLEYIAQREEAKKGVAARWGVQPMFLGIQESSGLSNAGPSQRVVTTLAAEIGQSVYADIIYPRLLKILGQDQRFRDVHLHWKMKPKSPEERNEIEYWQVEQAKWQAAMIRKQATNAQITGVDLEGQPEFGEVGSDPMMGGGMMGGGMPEGAPPPDTGAPEPPQPTDQHQGESDLTGMG